MHRQPQSDGKLPLRKRLFLYLGIPLISFVIMLFGVFVILTTVSYTVILETAAGLMPGIQQSGLNIMAFGTDATDHVQRADTIIVIHLDPIKKRIGVVSIPRDTWVKVDGHGMTKINHSYAYGGTTLLRQTVSEFLNLPIHHYMHINLDGVVDLVDELGGVELVVEKDLFYEDKAGGLKIDLKKGKQVLHGEQVLQFLRFRQDNQGDIGRIKRGQLFLETILHDVVKSGRLFEVPKLLYQLNQHLRTDLSLSKMVSLAFEFSDVLTKGQVDTSSIPGAITLIKGVSYWRPDVSAMDKVVSDVLLGFNGDTAPVKRVVIQTPDKDASQEERRKVTPKEVRRVADTRSIDKSLKSLPKQLIVEVLNGYGGRGEAKVAARVLKEKDVKVFRFGNAGNFKYDTTLLVSWKGNVADILILAQSLHVDPQNIIVYDRPDKPLDATLVLGRDWPLLKRQLGTYD